MFKKITDFARDMLGLLLAGLVFGAGLYGVLGLIKDAGTGREEGAAEVYKASAVSLPAVAEEVPEDAGVGRVKIYVEGEGEPPAWYRPDEPMAAVWTANGLDRVYVDSRGAKAYGWEITEAIRLLMLECGGESDEDIRAHCEVVVKQLAYAQAVGGWDDWGTTLYGVLHSHAYLETNGRIWTAEANPTEKLAEIFWDVWNNGYESDFRVQCFRSGWYHSWAIPAYQIGDTYYSINPWQDFSMFE